MAKKDKATQDFEKRLKQQNLEITGQFSTPGNKENKTGKKQNKNTNDNFNSRVLRQNREVANAPLIGDYRPNNNKKQIKGGVSEATIYANTPKMPSLPSNYGTKDYYKRQIEKTQNDIKRMTGNALNRDNGSSASRMGMYSDIRDKSERIQEYKNNLKLINAKEVFDKGIIGRNESTPYDDPEIVANFTDWRGKRTKSYYNAIENLKKRGVSDEQAEGLLYYYSLRSDERKKIDDRDKATLDITGGKADNIGMPGRIARGILSGMGSAIAQPLDSAINNFSDMQYDDTYIAKQSGLDNTSKSEAQQEAATKGMNKVGAFFYQNAEGLAEMGTTMVASGGNGTLTNLMFAGRGADDAYNTAINNGADQKQAAEYGLLKGFAEYLIYSKGIPKLKSMTPTSLAGSIFKDSGTMFSMSVASQAADAVAQTGVLGDKSTYAKQYDNLIKEGYSKDEAKRRMVMQLGQQLGKTAIGSLFSGAVIGTGKWGYSKLNPVENRPAVQGNDNEALTEEEAKYYEGITNEKDLKRRYYKYSKEYHPDSVTSRGMELNEDIINKWNTIKSAYEKINKNFDGANGATADEINKKVEEYRAYVRNYENMKNNTWTAKAKEKLNSIKESLKKMKSGSSSENIKRTAEEMINDVDEKVGKMDEVAPQTVEKPVEEFNAGSSADEVESKGIVPENTESRLQEEKIDELVDNKAAEEKAGVPESVSLETQKEDITSQRPINEQLMSVSHKIEDNAETSVQSSDEKVAESKKVVDISEAPISTKKAYIPDAVKMTDEEIHTSVQNGSYHPKYTLGNRVVTNKGTGYIQEIVKTGSESRQVIVNYDNGSSDVETMDAFNDIVDNPEEAMLYTFAVDFGYNGANTFIQSAPKDISRSISVMNRYSVNAHEMYEAGKNKLDFKDTFDNGVSFFMHKDMAQKFYRAGVMDRKDLAAVEMSRKLSSKTEPKNTISTKQSRGENVKADSKDISNYKEINIEDVFEKLSDGQKNEIEVINKISEATGVKVKYFESKAGENGKLEMANGFFDRKKNEIWIDINAGRNIKDIGRTTMVKTMSHELTHFIAKWSEEQYGSLEKYVLNLLEEKTGKAQKELIKDKMKQLNVKEDVAREEIIADACEMMLKDSKAIEQLAKENRTLFNKIKEWLHNFVESIKKAFEGVKATSEEAKAIMEYMEDVQEKWDNTMVEAVKNMNNIHHKGVSTSGKDYKETINSDLAEFVERNKIADQKETYRISEKISMKLASDIKTLLGIDVSDYANEIDSDSIIHINKDHGINGKSDHSMGDLSEIEHIEYILENYEDIEVGLGSKKYKNRDNSHAKTVVLTAKIENSNIYVVEAVPDTNKKVLKVVSEYKKETALQVNHSKNTPHRTSKNELASAVSNNSIAQESENDNNILKQDRNTDVIKKAANKLGVSERFLESNLEGRSRESAVQYLRNNNQVKNSFISEKGLEVTPVLKEPTSSYGMSDNIKEFVRDNNISYKTLSENSRLREEYAKLIEHSKDGLGKKFLERRAQDKAQEFIDDMDGAMSGDTEAKEKISREIELAKGKAKAYDDGMSMERGWNELIKNHNKEFEEFISSNIAPMYNNAERNKKEFAQNVKDNVESYVEKAEKHFGTTNDYSLAAYIDINGKMLDFSDGGAIRGTDHRGIAEVLDTPSGVSGTEALTAFMNAGNIRIMDTGIDISVEPNEKQISVLRDYIASRNGEIYIDFSKEDGSPAGSARYSKGTSVSRILADINNYFEDGTIPKNTYNAMSDFLYQARINAITDAESMTQDNGIASYTEERLEDLYTDYAAMNEDYSQAYLTRLSPQEFLKLTTEDDAAYYRIVSEAGKLDREKIKKNSQPIYLRIYDDGEVKGHEGRHRMAALMDAGITSVPVVLLENSDNYGKEIGDIQKLDSQDFSAGRRDYSVKLEDSIPITKKNDALIREKFLNDDNEKVEVRFSLRNVDSDADLVLEDLAPIIEENEKLKRQNELLEQQFIVTKGHKPKVEDVTKMCKKILKKYSSDYNLDDMVSNFKNIIDISSSSKFSNYAATRKALMTVAESVLKQSKNIDMVEYEQYAPLRKTLRTTRIALNEQQMQEAQNIAGSYNDYRKKLFGKVKLVKEGGIQLDSLWQELSEKYPEEFSRDTSDVNQVHELMDIVENIKQAKVTNTFNDEQELSMASYELMEDMVQEYFSLPTVETFADARIHELQEAREEYKQGIDEARQVYNEKYQKKVYKEQIKRLRNNLVSKIVNKKTVPFGLVDKTIDVLNEIYMGGVNISDVEKKTISQLMKSRVHGTKLTDVEAKQIVEKCSEILMGRADESVGRSEDRVVKWLLSIGYSDIQSRDIINICHDNYFTLAATNKIEKQIHRKLKMVQDAYSNFRKEDVPYEYSSEYDDRLNNLLQEVTDTVQDKAVISLDNYELDRLYKALKEVSHVIIDATNQIDDVKGRTNYERGVEIINEIRSRGGKNAYKTNNYVRKYALNSQRYINSITNWDKNSPLAQLINPVLEATRTKDKVTMDLKKPFDKLMADKEYDAFVGKRKGSLIEGAFFDRKGKPLTISHSQLVQIIMTWERNQGKGHLMASGATVYDVEQLLKGNIVKAVDMSHDTSLFKEKTIDRLREYLNDYDEAWIEAARTLFRVAGDLTNEVTMKTRGVPIAMDPNYCPIISDRAYLKTESSKVKRDATLEGQGRLKETTLHASNPVVIMGIEKLIDKTISESSSYYAYTVPLKNARKALNVTLAENKDSVRRTVRQVMGENTMNRIDRILDEIETGRAIDNSRDEFQKEFGFLYSNFVAAALNTNISVSIKQFASYPTAMAYIKERNLIKALAHRVDLDEIDKYTGAHYKRRLGLSHMELDIIQKSSKLQEIFDKLPGLLNGRKWIAAVDCFTTSRLWTACKYEVKGSGVKPDTDEFWRKTTELYHKVLEDTQPMYDVQYRTGIQKTNNIVAKTLAMFKTQPLQTFGMLYDACGEMKATGKRFKKSKSEENRNAYKNAKKRFYNGAIRALINSAVLFSALTFVANLAVNKTSAWRDEDTGEMTIESVLSNLVKNSIAGVAGMAIPVIGDRVYQMLTGDYYDMEEPTLTMINEAYQAINKLYEYASKIASGEKEFSISELLSNIETMAYDISSLCGIETKNIANIIKSSVYYVGHAVGNKSIENKLGYQFKSTQLYTSYYEALMKGDKDKAEQIKSKALDGNDDYSKFDTGVKNVLIDSDGRVTEAANAYINKDYEQYEKIINEIASSGFKKDIAIKAVESVINSLTKKEGESNKGDTDDEKFMYSVNDLVDAIMSDNKEAYDHIMNNLISAGKEADKLESSVKTKLKASFKAGNLKQNQAEQYLKDYLGYDNLKVYQTINNWNNKNDYSDLTEALRNGDTNLAQKYMELLYSRGNGKSTEAIRNGITSALKGEYIYKYYTGGEYTKMAYNILDAVEYLGFDREQYAENIEKWPTGADCYNSMNYYIAACDTKNAQNEIYDLYYTQNKKKSTILNAIESTYKPMYVYMKNNDMSTKEIKKTLIDCAVFLGENKEQYSSKIDDWE